MIKVIANTKGGVGKSVIASQVMPFLVNGDEIVIHEMDNNNRTKIENTALTFESIKADKSGERIDEILFDVVSESKVSHIIDCGGGEDTIKVLDFLIESDLVGLDYYIPTNADIEQAKNVLDTIKEIEKRDPEATINIILNRCNNLKEDDIKEQFVGIFGSEIYGLEGVIDEISEHTQNIYFLKDDPIFGVLKNIHNTTLFDVYSEAKDIQKDIVTLKKEWMKSGKKVFQNKMKHYKFLKQIINFVERDLKQFRG